MVTPTTKAADHDEPISPDDIVARGLMSQADLDQVCEFWKDKPISPDDILACTLPCQADLNQACILRRLLPSTLMTVWCVPGCLRLISMRCENLFSEIQPEGRMLIAH